MMIALGWIGIFHTAYMAVVPCCEELCQAMYIVLVPGRAELCQARYMVVALS